MWRLVLFLLFFTIILLPACREQSKEEIYLQGMQFVAAGNHQAAISLFKAALEKDPNYIDARFQLGVAYQETKKLDKAENEFEKVLLQQPSRSEASLRLARIYLDTERSETAFPILTELVKTRPIDVEVLSSMAQYYALQGEYESSEVKYRQALTIKSTHLKSQLGLSQVLFNMRRTDEALKMLQEAVAAHPESTTPHLLKLTYALKLGKREYAIESLQRIESLSPKDIHARYTLALLYLDAGRLEESLAIAEGLESSFPGHPQGPRIIGVYHYMTGDYNSALEELQKSLKLLPDMSGFYFTGLVYYRLNRYEQALSSFQKALDKNPDHEGSRLMVAQTLLKQGRIKDGMVEVQKILQNNAESGQAHNLLGSAYLANGQYDLALQELNKAIELNPSLASAYLRKGLFNLVTGNSTQGVIDLQRSLVAAPEILNTRLLLATYYLKQHNYPAALDLLKEGLNGSPDNALVYNYMAAAYIAQNKQHEAIVSLQKAKTAKPDYLAPYINLANFHFNRGETQSAIDEFLAALEVAPANLQIHLKLASLYELIGNETNAEKYYRLSSELDESDGYIAYAAFCARNGWREKSIEVLKTGYTKHPDNFALMAAVGKKLESLEQYDDAIIIYTRMEEVFPGKGLPLLIKAQLHKGDFTKANETATRVINENQNAENGYLLLSAIHEYRKEWPLAEKVIRQALKFNVESLVLKMKLATLYSAQGQYDLSQSTYDKILLQHPNSIPAIFCKGVIYDLLGNKLQAQDSYNHILEMDENYTPALNNLAYMTLEVYEDYEEALRLARKAFRNSPDNANVLDTLGYALLRNGEADKSIAFLGKAARLMPGEASIHRHLADAYKAVGRHDDAIAILKNIQTIESREVPLLEIN